MSNVAVIFARGGSKGIPRKNIRLLNGKPLIAYAIESALACPRIHRVVVSTDDAEIAEVAVSHGAEVPFIRPSELARDQSSEWDAWRHAIHLLDSGSTSPMEVFVSVPPTSPLREVGDITACIDLLLEGEADVVVTARPAERNPYFNMITRDEKGFAELVIKPGNAFVRRQDAPTVYDLTTVAYAARPGYVLNSPSLLSGRVKAVLVPPERAIDIDTELDFQFAEFLLSKT